MQFREVINQQEVKRHLVELFQHNRLSHALLFLGKEGSGALPLAISFAQYLVCEKVNFRSSSSPSLFEESGNSLTTHNYPPDSCGVCSGCIKAQQLNHPDIHFSYPTVTKKAGEKPIATDYISEWREFIKENFYGNSFDWIEHIK